MLTLVPQEIEAYAVAHTSAVPDLLEELREVTYRDMEVPQMQVGPIEGFFLQILARVARARRVLEIGTFTGYSALMMAAGLGPEGELITCDIDPDATAIAQRFFDRSPHGSKIQLKLGPALETLATLDGPFDLAFIDADKVNYRAYFDAIRPKMRPQGLIVVDNVLWSGKVLNPPAEQDASTAAIVAFNAYLRDLAEVDQVMLSVRDGMMLVVV